MQHPYLVDRALEPSGLSGTETHERLVDASAKLRLLRIMLPKLKAKGHRVLLFSQVKDKSSALSSMTTNSPHILFPVRDGFGYH